MSKYNNNTYPYKNYEYGTSDTSKGWYCEEQARTCNQCREPTIVTYNLRTHEVEIFNLDDNYPYQKTRHRHPTDNITRASVISAIAVEKRYLFEVGPGDFDPVYKGIVK